MGTHAYFFCAIDKLPTIRELFEWAADKGYRLKLHPEFFDDDEEEQAYLRENLDSHDWKDLSLADSQERWVGMISHWRKNDAYFVADMRMFMVKLGRVPDSPAKEAVKARLDAAVLLVDMQFNVSERETWPVQDAIVAYFYERLGAIAYLDNVGKFVQGDKTLLKV